MREELVGLIRTWSSVPLSLDDDTSLIASGLLDSLAATLSLPSDTLADEVEPYLLRAQFVIRSPRGRVATSKSYRHLGKEPPLDDVGNEPGSLF